MKKLSIAKHTALGAVLVVSGASLLVSTPHLRDLGHKVLAHYHTAPTATIVQPLVLSPKSTVTVTPTPMKLVSTIVSTITTTISLTVTPTTPVVMSIKK